MSKNAMLVAVLALAICPVYESRLMVSAPSNKLAMPSLHANKNGASKEDPEGDEKPRHRRDQARTDDDIDKSERMDFDKMAKASKDVLVHPIDLMRGEMCLAEHRIIVHSKCMDWLVKKCTDSYLMTDLCDRTRALVKEDCEDPDNTHQEEACRYAKLLGIDVNPRTKAKTVEETTAAPAPKEETTKAPKEEPKKEEEAPKKEEAVKEEPKKEEAAKEEKEEEDKPQGAWVAPDAKEGLQAQGYSGEKVKHVDQETMIGDWGKEYGHEVGKETKSGAQSLGVHPLMYLAIAVLAVFY